MKSGLLLLFKLCHAFLAAFEKTQIVGGMICYATWIYHPFFGELLQGITIILFFWVYFLFCYIASVESFQINCVALVI